MSRNALSQSRIAEAAQAMAGRPSILSEPFRLLLIEPEGGISSIRLMPSRQLVANHSAAHGVAAALIGAPIITALITEAMLGDLGMKLLTPPIIVCVLFGMYLVARAPHESDRIEGWILGKSAWLWFKWIKARDRIFHPRPLNVTRSIQALDCEKLDRIERYRLSALILAIYLAGFLFILLPWIAGWIDINWRAFFGIISLAFFAQVAVTAGVFLLLLSQSWPVPIDLNSTTMHWLRASVHRSLKVSNKTWLELFWHILLESLSPYSARRTSITYISPEISNRQTALTAIVCNWFLGQPGVLRASFMTAVTFPIFTGFIVIWATALLNLATPQAALTGIGIWLLAMLWYLATQCHTWGRAMWPDREMRQKVRAQLLVDLPPDEVLQEGVQWFEAQLDKTYGVIFTVFFLAALTIVSGIESRATYKEEHWQPVACPTSKSGKAFAITLKHCWSEQE